MPSSPKNGLLQQPVKGTPFEAPPEFYALAIQVGQIGVTDPDRLELLLRQTINAIAPDVPKISAQFKFAPLVASFTGLFGDPREIANSAQKTLGSSSHRQLRIARYWVRKEMKVTEMADSLAVRGTGTLSVNLTNCGFTATKLALGRGRYSCLRKCFNG